MSKLPQNIAALVNDQADKFYDAEVNSADAYSVIDRAALSAWNWYAGILNDTREAFDARIGERIDADLTVPARPCAVSGSAIIAAINDPEQWAGILATLDATPLRHFTTGTK